MANIVNLETGRIWIKCGHVMEGACAKCIRRDVLNTYEQLEEQLQQAQAELAGMRLMEAEGESFAETICRENERLQEQLQRLRDAIDEALPECWDTPKAEHILQQALTGEKAGGGDETE